MKRNFKITTIKNLFVALMLILGACSEDDGGGEETPIPVANFTVETDGLEATFTNTSLHATSYTWDFGDGNTSTAANPVHTYSADGSYTVNLTASNDEGTSHSKAETMDMAAEDPCATHDGSESGNLITGGNFETCDATYWTVNKVGEPELVSYEFGHETYTPTAASGGALYIAPDNLETTENEAAFIYQEVTVTDDGEYEIGALLRLLGENRDDPATAMTDYWFEFYVGTTEPVDGEDYTDGKVSGWIYGAWTGWAFEIPPTDGPLVHTYMANNIASEDGRFNLSPGDYYVGIKVGKAGGGSFGDGIAIDEFYLEYYGPRNECFDWDGTQEGNLIKGGQMGECDDKYWTVLEANLESFPVEFGYTAYTPVTGDGSALYFNNPESTKNVANVGTAGTIYQYIGELEAGTYQLSAQVKMGGVDAGMNQFWWEMYVWTEEPVEGEEYQPKESDADNALKVRPIAGYTHPGWGPRSDIGVGTATVAVDGEMQYGYNPYDLTDENGNFTIDTQGHYFFTFKFGTWVGSFGDGISIDDLSIVKVE